MGSGLIPPGQPVPLQHGEFVGASDPSQVKIQSTIASLDDTLYVRPEEFLRLAITNTAAAVSSVRLTWRTVTPDGLLHVGSQDFIVPADGSTNVFTAQMPEGFLISARVAALQANQRGQTFARLDLARAAGTSTNISSYLLVQGYIGLGWDIGYPNGPQLSSVDGPGAIVSVQQANPVAGSDWTYNVPPNHRQRIQSFSAIFTASAAVANRSVDITVDDGANRIWIVSLPVAMTASSVYEVCATGTNSPAGVDTHVLEAVLPPGLVLAAGWRIFTFTGAIQAADQWSSIFLAVEDWLAI